MKRVEVHRDVITMLKSGVEDRHGLHLMIDLMSEEDKKAIMESLVGFSVAMMTVVAVMSGRTPEQMINDLYEVTDHVCGGDD